MIRFIYKIIPCFIFFTKRFLHGFRGYNYGPVVCVHPDSRNDKGLIEHELTHSKQFFRTFGLHAILYWISKRYRLRAEVEAYAVQLKYYDESPQERDDRIILFGEFIAKDYNLDIYGPVAAALISVEFYKEKKE